MGLVVTVLIQMLLVLQVSCSENNIIRFMSTERPSVTYFNTKYLSYLNLTSQRYGRNSPYYFVGLHFRALMTIGNNIQMDFYFYEFLSNQYKRSFVEMHFGMCELIKENKFFGLPMRQEKFNMPCPFPAGEYHLYNMTIPQEQVPRSFPFKKGRIYANVSILVGPKEQDVEKVANVHIDMEVKQYNLRTKTFL